MNKDPIRRVEGSLRYLVPAEISLSGVDELISGKSLSKLLTKLGMTKEQYYLKYVLNSDSAPKCSNPLCNNRTKFVSLSKGFLSYCCISCSNISQ